MKLFVDTSDVVLVNSWLKSGAVCGVTTNPALLRASGIGLRSPELAEIIKCTTPHPVSVQVSTTDPSQLLDEAVEIAGMGSNVVVKVPVLDERGEHTLASIAHLAKRGVTVNATACFSVGQAIMAASAGARYVSLLAGRISDEGGDPVRVIDQVRRWIDDGSSATEILAASVRSPGDVINLISGRPHILTVPPAVLAKMALHHYSRETVASFYRTDGAAR